MRKTSFALALLASVAMTVVPVAPSFAAAPAKAPTANEMVTKQAAAGGLVVLSPTQMNDLARTHPRLHAKLDAAHKAGTMPSLSKSEKQLVRTLTAQNMNDIKAGAWWGAGWVIVAIAAGVLLLLFIATPLGCGLFPWAPACAPRPVAARY